MDSALSIPASDLVDLPVSLAAAMSVSPANFFVFAQLGTGCQNFQTPYGLVGALSSLDIAALQQMDSGVSILDSEYSFGSVVPADLVSLPVSLAASLPVAPIVDLSDSSQFPSHFDSPVSRSGTPLDTSLFSHSAVSSVVFLGSSSAVPTPRSLVQRSMLSYLHSPPSIPLPPSPIASSPAAAYMDHFLAFNAALAAPLTVFPASTHRVGLARSSDVAIRFAALPHVRQGVDIHPDLAFIVVDSIPPLRSYDDESIDVEYDSDVALNSPCDEDPSASSGSYELDAVALFGSSPDFLSGWLRFG